MKTLYSILIVGKRPARHLERGEALTSAVRARARELLREHPHAMFVDVYDANASDRLVHTEGAFVLCKCGECDTAHRVQVDRALAVHS